MQEGPFMKAVIPMALWLPIHRCPLAWTPTCPTPPHSRVPLRCGAPCPITGRLTGLPSTLRVGKLCSPSLAPHRHVSRSPAGQCSNRGRLTVVRNGTVLGSLHTDVTELGSLILDLERDTLLSLSLTHVQTGIRYLKGKVPSLASGFAQSLVPSCVRERAKGLQCHLFWQGDTPKPIPGTSWG